MAAKSPIGILLMAQAWKHLNLFGRSKAMLLAVASDLIRTSMMEILVATGPVLIG